MADILSGLLQAHPLKTSRAPMAALVAHRDVVAEQQGPGVAEATAVADCSAAQADVQCREAQRFRGHV